MNIVLSGPSGSGKGTLTEKLMQERGYKKFVTVTTRKPRDGERNGFDYIFLSNDKFEEYNKLGILHNIKEYDGNYYASFESDMDNIISDTPMIFQLTPDRALEMKKRNPDTILILILPPNADELNTRRGKRSTKRVEDDIRNLEIARSFDCVVVMIT